MIRKPYFLRQKDRLEKARTHKYLKRKGVSGHYEYTYEEPASMGFNQGRTKEEAKHFSETGMELGEQGTRIGHHDAVFAKPVKLIAEHSEAGKKKVIAKVSSMYEAANLIEKLDESGKWPEGFEATLTQPDGSQWMYTGKWERYDTKPKEQTAERKESYKRFVAKEISHIGPDGLKSLLEEGTITKEQFDATTKNAEWDAKQGTWIRDGISKAEVATATMPRGHEAYTRTVEGKQQQIRQKGSVIKKPQPLEKPESATVVGADHKQFTQLLDSYFHNQEEMKMMMNLIDTHKTEMEAAMSELRPLLGKFSNLEKAEQKFKTEFKEGDWNYKFLSYTKETKPYKDLYTKAFTMLDEIQRQEMKKAETALSKITGQEKFEREPVTKDLIKSYIGKPETEETLSQFRRDVLSLILLKAAKKATGEDEDYEKDKEETGKRPLPKDKAKKEPKAKEPEEEEDDGLGEAHQQLIEALQNLIAAKETGVHLLEEFFSRKKEEPKKEKAEKKPKKEKDEKDEKDVDDSDSRKAEKKDKKKAEEDEGDEKESRKSLVEIVTPIVFKRYNDELQKALEQEKQDAFLEAFEKWEKACGGAKPVFRFGVRQGKQAKKDQKKREKEDLEKGRGPDLRPRKKRIKIWSSTDSKGVKTYYERGEDGSLKIYDRPPKWSSGEFIPVIEKARPHKYIRRTGVSGKYDYVYSDPARYHQTKIARDTLKLSDAMAGVMGGPTKAEARAFLGLAADGSEDHRPGAAKGTFVKESAGQYGSEKYTALGYAKDPKATGLKRLVETLHSGNSIYLKDRNGDRFKIERSYGDEPAQLVVSNDEGTTDEYTIKGGNVLAALKTVMTDYGVSNLRESEVKEEAGAYGKVLPSDEEIAKVVSDILDKEKEPIAVTHKIMLAFINKYKLTMDNIGELMPKIKLAAKIYEQTMGKEQKPEEAVEEKPSLDKQKRKYKEIFGETGIESDTEIERMITHEIKSLIPQNPNRWGGLEEEFKFEGSRRVGDELHLDFMGDRSGGVLFKPRAGVEDDDQPDFVGAKKVGKAVEARLKLHFKKKFPVKVWGSEKGYFTVSIKGV